MEQLDKEFMDIISKMSGEYGSYSLPLKIFAVLYIEPEEICLEELAKRTGYSLAAVSQAVKLLESVGNAQRTTRPGSRKVYFRCEKNIFKMVKLKFKKMKADLIEPLQNQVPDLLSRYRQKARGSNDKKRKRKLEILESFLLQMQEDAKLLDKMIHEAEIIEARLVKDGKI